MTDSLRACPRSDGPGGARRRRRRVLTGVLAVGLTVAAACGQGPPRPTPPALGSLGPCGRTNAQLTSNTANAIYVAYPTGAAATPNLGGTCGDSARPVVFVVHGYLANSNILYEGIIDHFTRAGNIVVMATYGSGNLADVPGSANIEVAAIDAAVPQLDREDMSKVGLIGHSLGGGMLPFVTQQVASRGWGGSALWLFSLAPYQGIGTGTIALPAHTRAVVEAYSDDGLVNRSVGVDLFHRMSMPNSQKDHVTVRTSSLGGVTLSAAHTSPNSIIAPDDAIKFFGIYRVGDIVESCAVTGQHCSDDMGFMGTWSDGTAVLPSVVSDNP
ncbi:MAG TPA: hypothetical protein VK611_25400 [Acidimicrobiales bacterium]|nr:hypothetical protein [Acidimicrobiales bacterium]